jgi:spore coat protein U-like protein
MDHVVFGDSLDYNIYTSPAMVQVWGDGTHGTVTAYFSGVRSSNTPPIIVYGKIFPLQNVSAGSYNEQLVVTITY